MSRPETDTLTAARLAYEGRQWESAYALLGEADAETPLAAEDVERQSWAARWSGKYTEMFAALERAEKAYTKAGNRRGAARMAMHFGADMYQHGKEAVAFGCLARASELLAKEKECSEHALYAFLMSMGSMARGDTDSAQSLATEAREIAVRVGDRELEALAKLSLGHVFLSRGNIKEGIALHDEASAIATSGDLGPFASGYIYCSVIVACRNRADWSRAAEWTDQATRWCDQESVQYYPGLCRVHRAEVLRFRGAYDDAKKTAAQAMELLMRASPLAAGWAHREMAEIALRRGDLTAAREGCLRALEFGTEPQPAFAKLQLTEGDTEGALHSIESALESTRLMLSENRVDLLPAKVTIALAAGDIDRAAEAVERVEELASELGTPAPLANAACARGELELARGEHHTAAEHLRQAWRLWCEIEAPYDAARAQALLSRACAAQGDLGSALIQMQAACSSFERIGALSEASRLRDEIADLERRRRASQTTEEPARSRKTFMFTDIVDSTKLVELLGDESWDALLQWHHRTLRRCFEEGGGEEVGCEGDGFFVAFATATAAITCATEIQRRLASHRLEHGFAPHVRIGLHTAEALQRGDDYAGKGIHTAARIAATGGANDIVTSVETVEGGEIDVTTSGPRELQLKGLAAPVRVVTIKWRS
jgi:class 3 adenylate cyclase